jgi:hypothetical protein
MAEDGVLQQWLQLHRLAATDILTVITTLSSEFRYVSLYVIGSQGILVATNDARKANPTPAALARLNGEPRLAELRRISARPIDALTLDRVLDPAGVDRFVVRVGNDPSLWIATDDNLLLEYSTPKANVNDGPSSYAANIRLLARHAGESEPPR